MADFETPPMIDVDKVERMKAQEVPGFRPATLAALPEEELRRLRDEITGLLPPSTLASMNLETELIDQYRRVTQLQREVFEDEEIPANQKAQVAGQVATTLQQLVKMQSEFHTAERFKLLENLMIVYMRKMPLELAEQFLADYERLEVMDV